uniref:Reverse transcriptase domain-containing protein n=1 Tax=Molossus molossus TaxID=27622 RepID=A0A7J8J6A6_MOLMO|nr:hypothetical protein HJG59_009600 [Molossus molossus]
MTWRPPSQKKNKTIHRINETKNWFFEKLKKVDGPLARLTKKQRGRIQRQKIRNERGAIVTDTTEIQKMFNKYYEQLYSNKFENISEMDKFLETHSLPKLNQKEIENLNRQIKTKEIEDVIMSPQQKKSQGPMALWGNLPILLKLFQKTQEGRLPYLFYEGTRILIPKPEKDTKRKSYRPISLRNIDAKIMNKILANRIQQYIKKLFTMTKWVSSPGMQG